MIYEFALDPEAIADWPSFRYFIDQFGVPHGRLISRFPKNWKRMVYHAVSSKAGDVERLKIVERLKDIDDKLLKQTRPYEREHDWITNAIAGDAEAPFRAIIGHDFNVTHPKVLRAGEIDSTNELWSVPTQQFVFREPRDLAKAAELLLRQAKKIKFVDPHFKPTRRKWLTPLRSFIERLTLPDDPNELEIEYHFKLDENVLQDFDDVFKSECQERLAPIVPNGFKMRLIRWRKRPDGKSIHARYVITERGAVWYDYGLDEGDDAGDQTHAALVDRTVHFELWSDFEKHCDLTMCTYEFDNETEIIGTKAKG